jgi:hypothetical protein
MTHISHLSSEILAEICAFLPSTLILRLTKLTGCPSLDSKLSGSLYSLIHTFPSDEKCWVRPTALFKQFSNLRVFHLCLHPALNHAPAILDLEAISAMPPTITDLKMDFKTSMDSFLVNVPYRQFELPFLVHYPSGMHQKVVSLSKLLPNLTKLYLRARQGWGNQGWSTFMQQAFLEHLPATLQSLTFRVPFGQFVGFDLLRHIPARVSLEHLDLRNSTQVPVRVPVACTAFRTLRCVKLSSDALEKLPSTLTYLQVLDYAATDVLLKALPPSVTVLKLGEVRPWFGGYSEGEWFSLLPSNLKSFGVRGEMILKSEQFQRLPPNLEALSLNSSSHVADFSALPRALTSLKWRTSSARVASEPLDLATLPRTLKTLVLQPSQSSTMALLSGLEHLPVGLTSLQTSTLPYAFSSLIPELPKTLASLKLTAVHANIDTACLRLLPPSLTSLQITGTCIIPFEHLETAIPHLHRLVVPAIRLTTKSLSASSSQLSPYDTLRNLIPPLLRYGLETVAELDESKESK